MTVALDILIIGAGVGGPAAALLLRRANPDHRVTVIERFPKLRANGQQIDLRAQGIPIMRRLGLLGAVQAVAVAERGLEILDRRGRRAALVAANDTGQGSQSFTSEYEVMRGDLVQVLYEASLEEYAKAPPRSTGSLRYQFNKMATDIAQEESGSGVNVTFTDGAKARYDLVIGADGQYSHTRRQVFGQSTSDVTFRSLGVYSAFYSIPPALSDSPYARTMHAPGGRGVMTRPSKPHLTGVYMMLSASAAAANNKESNVMGNLAASLRRPVPEQKAAWTRAFADLDWPGGERERILDGLEATDDFYAFELAQVRLDRFTAGRVALLGDAGYVPGAATGMGTTLSLAGAYVLAGELARCSHPDEVPAALRSYEATLRPLVTEAQKIPPGFPRLWLPRTVWRIALLHWLVWAATKLQLNRLLVRLLPENKGGWTPPEYPELYRRAQ